MKELNEYRDHLINKLVSSAHEFRDACLKVSDPFVPLEAGGWNVHQVASHARDADQMVYGIRARRTIEEDNPIFQNFDGDAYSHEHYSSDEPLTDILGTFVKGIEALAELLRDQAAEAWSRESSHEKFGGGLTLQVWVERSLAHIQEHLETIQKVK